MATASATPRVDIHAHVMVSAAQDLVAPYFTLDKEPALFFASEDSRQVSGRGVAEAMCKLTTPADRIPDMERMGIDLQVLSPSPNQYYYWTEPELGLAAARLVNDGLAAMVATDRERFAGMGTVPLQDTLLAVRELERCIDALGFCGIEIGSHVAGIDLGDPRFAPFFAAAEARKVELLAAVPNLDPAQRAAIAGGNALRLLGLEGATRAGQQLRG